MYTATKKMDRDYRQAREVTQLYADLGEAQQHIELPQARIATLDAEVTSLLALSQECLHQLQHARASLWV